MRRIDDKNLVEFVGQRFFVGIAHRVDRLPRGPERRHGHQRRLHQTPGGIVWKIQRALQGGAVDRRHRVEDLVLILLVEIFQ